MRFGLTLTDRVREIAILEVARHARSEFEWYAHVRIGRAAGLTAAEVEAVRVGARVDSPPAEVLARQVTQALAQTGDLDRRAVRRPLRPPSAWSPSMS